LPDFVQPDLRGFRQSGFPKPVPVPARAKGEVPKAPSKRWKFLFHAALCQSILEAAAEIAIERSESVAFYQGRRQDRNFQDSSFSYYFPRNGDS